MIALILRKFPKDPKISESLTELSQLSPNNYLLSAPWDIGFNLKMDFHYL